MTANDMTNRDAAQIAALPKSAVWSQLQSSGVLEGGAGLRSLTSERTEHTSSPAMSGGHPKRLPLGRPETVDTLGLPYGRHLARTAALERSEA